MAYLPQTVHFFYGTIEQNLRMSNPLASITQIIDALEKADVFKDVMALKDRIHTTIRDDYGATFPAGFLQKLSLARVYLNANGLMLLDEPGNYLNNAEDNKFIEAVNSFRGHNTLFIVTHRPSHLKMADKNTAFRSWPVANFR